MKISSYIRVVSVIGVSSLLVISGCATTSKPVDKSDKTAAVSEPDKSSPTVPVSPIVVEAPKAPPKAPEPPPKPGSVASVLKKMESSAYTLYWREKDTYSYYIGGVIDAEYQPNKGLNVRVDQNDDQGLVCEYSEDGKLSKFENIDSQDKAQEACSKLMFTLDDELSD